MASLDMETATSPITAGDIETNTDALVLSDSHFVPWYPDHHPGQMVFLLELAAEIRWHVYETMYDNRLGLHEGCHNGALNTKVDVTTARPRKHGRRAFRLQTMFPALLTDFAPLSNTCRQLSVEVGSFLASNVTFLNRNSSSLTDMTTVLGSHSLGMIRHFELRLEFRMKCYDQPQWPAAIQFLVEEMPNLQHLKLYSEWDVSHQPYPPNESRDAEGSVTRLQQERRSQIRLLAHLHHPNLDRVIHPGNAATDHDAEFDRRTHYVFAEKYRGQRYRHDWSTGDEILNISLIQREKWSDLCHDPVSRFFIVPPENATRDAVASSTVADQDSQHFWRVTERAYKPWDTFKANRWQKDGPIHVDNLIDQARRTRTAEQSIAKSVREPRARGRGRAGARSGRGRGRGSASERPTGTHIPTTSITGAEVDRDSNSRNDGPASMFQNAPTWGFGSLSLEDRGTTQEGNSVPRNDTSSRGWRGRGRGRGSGRSAQHDLRGGGQGHWRGDWGRGLRARGGGGGAQGRRG